MARRPRGRRRVRRLPDQRARASRGGVGGAPVHRRRLRSRALACAARSPARRSRPAGVVSAGLPRAGGRAPVGRARGRHGVRRHVRVHGAAAAGGAQRAGRMHDRLHRARSAHGAGGLVRAVGALDARHRTVRRAFPGVDRAVLPARSAPDARGALAYRRFEPCGRAARRIAVLAGAGCGAAGQRSGRAAVSRSLRRRARGGAGVLGRSCRRAGVDRIRVDGRRRPHCRRARARERPLREPACERAPRRCGWRGRVPAVVARSVWSRRRRAS